MSESHQNDARCDSHLLGANVSRAIKHCRAVESSRRGCLKAALAEWFWRIDIGLYTLFLRYVRRPLHAFWRDARAITQSSVAIDLSRRAAALGYRALVLRREGLPMPDLAWQRYTCAPIPPSTDT
ncbi:hypothetical protein [Paraburkholderia sp. USG1]|uniref:hypothetical protein n=1 Tax=Paraburkholderia sp. USG1 TaxID=2952268 RepID=UPI0012F64C78|nr:hypothetical protein [Paraburkholderia sp. USG1]